MKNPTTASVCTDASELYIKAESLRAVLEAFRDLFASSHDIDDDIVSIKANPWQFTYLLLTVSDMAYDLVNRAHDLEDSTDRLNLEAAKAKGAEKS